MANPNILFEGISDEGRVDILMELIKNLETSVTAHRLALRSTRVTRLQRHILTGRIDHENQLIRNLKTELRYHAEDMVNKHSEIVSYATNVASSFPTVEILESLHSRISVLESKQA